MMREIDQKMIDAIVRRAAKVCPGSLVALGVYGSVATGDLHAKSDLDLMMLINDDAGRQLAKAFVMDDIGVGYDLYCTTWEQLEEDAAYRHPHLAKLLDSQIVYVADDSVNRRIDEIRVKARLNMTSERRDKSAMAAWARAKDAYAECMLAETPDAVRDKSAEVIYEVLNTVMLHYGGYFRKGVKRTFEEIGALGLPFDAKKTVLDVVCATSTEAIRAGLTILMNSVKPMMSAEQERVKPDAENLRGTYEEMFSNWRNKMTEAAENGDVFASFMNMASMQNMLNGVAAAVDIPHICLIGEFNAHDLQQNAAAFDKALGQYLREYEKAGVEVQRYRDIEEFVNTYGEAAE